MQTWAPNHTLGPFISDTVCVLLHAPSDSLRILHFVYTICFLHINQSHNRAIETSFVFHFQPFWLRLLAISFWYKSLSLIVRWNVTPQHAFTSTEGENCYSATLFLTLVLDGMDAQRHVPDALFQEINPVPIADEIGWAPGSFWSGMERKNALPP